MIMANEEDKEWLKKCIDHPDKYKIFVDNDDIFVVELTEDDSEGMEISPYTFNDFGEEFIVWLLREIGVNAEFV